VHTDPDLDDAYPAGVFGPVPGERPDAAAMRIMGMLAVSLEANTAELRHARETAEDRYGSLFYSPIAAIVSGTTAAQNQGVTTSGALTTFANAEIWGPKTGFFWAIQRFGAYGLSGPGTTQVVQGSVTSPGTFQTLVTQTGLVPFATYNVTVQAATSGTTGTPEVNNFRLASTGVTALIVPSGPGISETTSFTYTTGASGNLVITTGGATPTTGAVYSAVLSFTSPADQLNLFRGQPAPQNFLNNLELAGPEWRPGHTSVILQPGDFITAQASGLVSTSVALNFDAIVGRLDRLQDFIS
jgi:hypothetical protein